MRLRLLGLALLTCAAVVGSTAVRPSAQAGKPLEVYFIDVEGGQATLFVTPSGQSMLIDTGYPGFGDRDVKRVVGTIKQAGVTKLDYFLVTHYHEDHVGNASAIAAQVPITNFIDHGANVETDDKAKALFDQYAKARAAGKHILAKPGDKIPLRDLDMTIVAANGDRIMRPVNGGGAPTPDCASTSPMPADPSENARSVGSVISFGRFRMIDMGDLTWNKELDLVCPNNLVGTVDLYLTTHHGRADSNVPPFVNAIQPRVIVMNNGPKKGGMADAMKRFKSAPKLEDFWQLHYSVDAGDLNQPAPMIANLDESTAHYIKLTAQRDGSFAITNARTGQTKNYRASTR
jgi:beta-lactamase superfamily II metal-dependent hydrolase